MRERVPNSGGAGLAEVDDEIGHRRTLPSCVYERRRERYGGGGEHALVREQGRIVGVALRERETRCGTGGECEREGRCGPYRRRTTSPLDAHGNATTGEWNGDKQDGEGGRGGLTFAPRPRGVDEADGAAAEGGCETA